MGIDKEKKFYVVRFLELPYDDINRYICVPTSWITKRSTGERNVRVVYPIEDPEKTKERVKNAESFKKHWNTYKATIIFGVDEHDNANAWITKNSGIINNKHLVMDIKDSSDGADIQNTMDVVSNENGSSNMTGSESSAALESNPNNFLPNQSLNPDKNEPQEHTTVAANDFAIQFDKQETDDTIETNSYNRNIDEQRLSTPATPPLLDENQQSRLAQLIKGGTLLTINGSQLHQQPRNQELSVNQIVQRHHHQNVTKNTSSPFEKPTKPVHHTRLSKRLKEKQNQSDQIIKNKTADVNKLSDTENQVNEVFEDLHEKPLPPYKVIIKNDYNVNKIIITRSTDNQGTSSQRTADNVSSVNKTKHACQKIEKASEKQLLQMAPKTHFQQDLHTKNTIVRTTGGELVDLLVHSHYKAKGTPPAEKNYPYAENQISNFSKLTNEELKISTDLENMRQITRAQREVAGEYNTSDYFHQTPDLQEVTQNIPPFVHNIQTSAIQPSTKYSHQKPKSRAKHNHTNQRHGLTGTTQNIPSVVNRLQHSKIQPRDDHSHQNHPQAHVKGFLLQDPRTGLLFIKAAKKIDDHDQRQYAQGPTQNMPPAYQNIPNLVNQPGQYSQHPQENQYIPYSQYTLPTQRPQQTRGPVEMNSAYQRAYPQNIQSSVQNSSNAANCSCQYPHGRPNAPVAQAHYYQDPRLQKTFLGSNEANPSAQSVCLNKVTRPPVIVNPINTSNQSRQTLRNPINEQFGLTLPNDSNQQPLQGQPVEQNYVKQSDCPQGNTQNGQTAQYTKNSANKLLVSSIEERHSQFNADQKMSAVNPNGQKGRPDKQNSPNAVNVISEKKRAEQNLLRELKCLFSKMNSEIDKNNELIKSMSNKTGELEGAVKTMTNSVRNHCQIRINAFRLKNAVNIQNNPQKYKITKKQRHDNNDDKLKKKHDQPSSFVLPPEYNPKNSKWTLKYRKALLGTVEIISGSRVFVNRRKFAYCKRVAKDSRSLVRLLLTEVFSMNALRVCSLTGAKRFSKDVRPGLDKHAREVLFMFVNMYGNKMGWPAYDSKAVEKSARGVIQKLRPKRRVPH